MRLTRAAPERTTASDGFDLRTVRPEEYAAVAELVVEAYREVGETFPHQDYVAEVHNVAARAEVVPVLVTVDRASGVILGSVTYVPGPGPFHEGEFGAQSASFRMLAVAPRARGRGVGRALVEACIERARSDGRRSIGIYTRPFMTAAHRMYESLGFDRAPELDWEFEPREWLWAYRLKL